jgi:hypothetical protein
MAFGYEGYVKVDSKYALGTGTAVPRALNRIDSQGAFGGGINAPVAEIGIGAPRVYGWDVFDGSLNFEITKDFFQLLKDWIYDRDGQKSIFFSPRKGGKTEFTDTFWNSISISADAGSAIGGSLGFVAIERADYDYGDAGVQGYYENVAGVGLLCPIASGMPSPLNPSGSANQNPVPYWNSSVQLGTDIFDFESWSLDFAQDVVKFPACMATVGPQGPAFVGVGPMSIILNGTWMWIDESSRPATFPTDTYADAIVTVAGLTIKFKTLEKQTISDDVQSPDSTTPVSMEYAIYELQAATS